MTDPEARKSWTSSACWPRPPRRFPGKQVSRPPRPTEKGGRFSEVIVDHGTGKVAKSEAITEGEISRSPGAQTQALAKANLSLSDAVAKAVAANKGFRAVSAVASVKDGHPVAEISLLKGGEWKAKADVEKFD
jgi:hypothetical protein